MKKTLPFLTLVIALSGCLLAAEPELGSVKVFTTNPDSSFLFSPEEAKNHYFSDFIRWTVEDDGKVPRPDAVLAVGSSSMRLWVDIRSDLAPLDVIHRGFGGSKMEDVLAMIRFFQRYKSAKVLVYEGDNDLLSPNLTPEQFVAHCATFVDEIRKARPDAKIYFLSVKPSPARENIKDKQAQANALLKAMCASGKDLVFIDVATPMLDDNGQPRPELFSPDKLHMTKQGYKVWTDIIRNHLMEQ